MLPLVVLCSGSLAGRSAVCDGDQDQQLFKGFLLPSLCVFEVEVSSSDTSFSLCPHKRGVKSITEHESPVGNKLLSNNSYAKNKRNPRLKLWLRLLRFCSWQLLFYLDGWCVFILCVILQCAHLCPFFTAFWSVLQMNYCKEMHIYIWIVYNHIYYVHTSMNNTHLLNFPLP